MKKMIDPLPTNPTAQKLIETFRYKWKTIEKSDSENQWRTNDFPMRPRSLWNRWQDAATLIGVRFGTGTTYAMIDVDSGSQYLSDDGIKSIQAACELIGLVRSLPIRSSWSGGMHLYFPLPQSVSSFSLACSLRHTLESQGITVKAGQCEIFPNIKAYAKPWEITEYNGHRLPLQPGSGSSMLDHNFNPIAGNLDRFFWQWDFCCQAQDMQLLIPALEQGRQAQRVRKKKRTGKLSQWRNDLRLELEKGWSGKGQTNSLLRAIATYGRVFEGLGNEELGLYIQQMAYSRPGYLEHCNHQHQIPKKSLAWSRWATRFYWPVGSKDGSRRDIRSVNDERHADATNRITQTVIRLAESGQLAATASKRLSQLCELAKTSAQTLYKNLELWHPGHWCVMHHPEGNTATLTPQEQKDIKPPEPLSGGALHTTPPLLRCRALTDSLEKLLPQGKGGVLGGGKGVSVRFEGV